MKKVSYSNTTVGRHRPPEALESSLVKHLIDFSVNDPAVDRSYRVSPSPEI